jgi:hypothetical protein
MNKTFTKALLFLMVSIIFSNSLIKGYLFVDYTLHQAEITRKFCENKAKPKLQCNGKCHLAKQLAKQEKEEKSTSETSKFKLEVVELTAPIQETEQFSYPIISSSLNKAQFNYSETTSDSYLASIFHPPTLAA